MRNPLPAASVEPSPETMPRAADPAVPSGLLAKPSSELELQETIQIALKQSALLHAQAREIDSKAQSLVQTREELSAVTARLLRAQEQEREEIARDLHDDIGQRLALLHVTLQSLWQKFPAGVRHTYHADCETVLALVAELSNDLRAVSHRLHPSMLDDLGLVVALRQLLETFEERHSLPSRFSARGVPEISPQVALALYRIVQEALHNITKHAGPDATVTVTLIGARTKLSLTVRDSGKGFDLQSLRQFNGIGLSGIMQRAETIGGQVSITSVPGQGTRIHVSIPLDTDPRA